jgi:CubicO group peptidase (beta-lactamase class C family)
VSTAALQRIAPMLKAYVDSGKLAGIVAAVARHGKVAYLEAVGPMDVERKTPMRTDAVFRICSMTKPVTAAAILMLFDRGKLRIDDPVSKYIPAFANPKVYAGGSSAAPTLRAPDRPITIEHLLTHTAGLTYGIFGNTPGDSIYVRAKLNDFGRTVAQQADSIARLPLLFSPGTRWNYSLGLDVLGRVVEVVSGKPFDRFLDDELFGPLGMSSTSFHMKSDFPARMTAAYTRGPDGKLAAIGQGPCGDYTPAGKLLEGGSGLLSTVPDYLRFAQMLLNGGELDGHRVLKRETVALMMQNHLPAALMPLSLAGLGEASQTGYGQGYGGIVLVDSAASGLPGSPGIYRWLGYESTFFWVDPKRDLVGMLFMQFLPAGPYPIDHQFQRLVYAAVQGK